MNSSTKEVEIITTKREHNLRYSSTSISIGLSLATNLSLENVPGLLARTCLPPSAKLEYGTTDEKE